jgi:hypothetical protein
MKYFGNSIRLKRLEFSVEFDPDFCFIKPFIWKIWPPQNKWFGDYYGHTWAIQFNWLWFILGVNNLT